MEQDSEVSGQGNSYDYGARIYNPRLGRWLSLDPLQKKYPHLSHYIYTRDNPIIYSDIGGTEERYEVIVKTDWGTITYFEVTNKDKVIFEVVETYNSVKSVSRDIVTTRTIDLRTGVDVDQINSIQTSTPIRNTGSAAVSDAIYLDQFKAWASDLLSDKNSGNKSTETQNFGFRISSNGGPESDWVNGLPKGKNAEDLDLTALLAAASSYGYSGDLADAFETIKKLKTNVQLSKDMEALKTAVDIIQDVSEKTINLTEKIKSTVETAQGVDKSSAPVSNSPVKNVDFVPRAVQTDTLDENGNVVGRSHGFDNVPEGSGQKDTIKQVNR